MTWLWLSVNSLTMVNCIQGACVRKTKDAFAKAIHKHALDRNCNNPSIVLDICIYFIHYASLLFTFTVLKKNSCINSLYMFLYWTNNLTIIIHSTLHVHTSCIYLYDIVVIPNTKLMQFRPPLPAGLLHVLYCTTTKL